MHRVSDPDAMTRDELIQTVRELRKDLDATEAYAEAAHRRIDTLAVALAGDEDEFSEWAPEEMEPIADRLSSVEDTVASHDEKFEMFVVEDGSSATPDERALHLRQVLWNKGKNNDGKACLTRDEAESSLGGGLHNGTVLDAMKRAADGHDADLGNGSSDIKPFDGITFASGSLGGGQSRLELDADDLTMNDLHQNLMTENRAGGGR
jgi:hypothetical protein